VATGTIDLGGVYRELIAAAEQREMEAQTIRRYEDKFQIFLGLAFALLLVEGMVGEHTGRRGRRRE
jgi:hypothetical protein